MPSFEEMLSKKTVFENISVLSPHYIPKELPFRESHIKEIMFVVSPALRGQKPRNLIIYGKTGTGKTCTVKKVQQEFNAFASSKPSRIHYINCRIYNSRYRIMQKLLKFYVKELEKSGFGLPFLYEKLIETLEGGEQIVVVLDEIDMTKDLDDLVYTLTRANDEAIRGGVSIIGISNKLSFKESLDPRSKSSLYETEMIFQPYTAEQLRKILEQRVREGFVEGAVDQSAINLAAAITSQESGDARYALKLIMKAGEIADQEGKSKVTDEEVESARMRVELDITKETINTLPAMHQIVLYAIARLTDKGSKYARLDGEFNGVLFSGEVYEEYVSLCRALKKKPRTSRWYKEYLNDLEVLGLITTTPSGKGVRGQTTLIRLGPSADTVMSVLKDSLL